MTKSILVKKWSNDIKTLKLMDEFETLNDDMTKKYDTLLLDRVIYIYKDSIYKCGLYIQRMPIEMKTAKEKEYIESTMTFTDFKKYVAEREFPMRECDYSLQRVITESIPYVNFRDNSSKDYFFQFPVQFNAQNSSNRTGYGSEYIGGCCVYEGTLYGETTTYMVVGLKLV